MTKSKDLFSIVSMDDLPIPFYQQIKQIIVQQIQSGVWPINYRIPSESQLVEQLGVSRMTINRALRELTSEGVLVRIQGVGTFVAKPKNATALFEIHNIADEIIQRGNTYFSEIVVMEKIFADRQQAINFEVDEGSLLFHSLIVHYENKLAVQIESRYVNAKIVPNYLAQDFTQLTPNKYLNDVAPATEGEHIVEAVLASKDECDLLKIDQREPCLLIYRRTWMGSDVVSNAKLTYPGSRYSLKGRFGI